MYPNDAITYTTEIHGAVTEILTDSGDFTILAVAMQQSNVSSATKLQCGSDLVAQNYATNFSNVTMNYQCDDDIVQIVKTGNDYATVIVTYVPYLTGDYSTTTQFGYNPRTDIASSTDVQFYGSISAGEFIISIILMIGLLFYLMNLLARAIGGIATNRKLLQYHGGDVPQDSI